MSSKIQIKICGINSNQSAEACNGADFVGFVFYQKSPRFVTAFEAKEISKYLQTNLKKLVYLLILKSILSNIYQSLSI